MSNFTFKENLYFNRKESVLSFSGSTGEILVCKAGVSISYPDLVSFLERYIQVDHEQPEKYLTEDVAQELKEKGILKTEKEKPAPPTPAVQKPEPKKTPPKTEIVNKIQRKEPLERVEKGESPEKTPAVAKIPPAKKVAAACDSIKDKVLLKLDRAGAKAVADGQFDDTIQNVVEDVCRELQPRQILTRVSSSDPQEKNSPVDRIAEAAIASQAFGNKLKLSEKELFLLAKSALIHGLKEQDRENLPVIKRNLLSSNPSVSFSKRLKQSYSEIARWLRSQKVDKEISSSIEQSQYIYFQQPAVSLALHPYILGLTDAFLALKEGGEKLLIIEDILLNRLRVSARDTPFQIDSLPGLIKESCYNEFRASCLENLSGGDHCAFTRLDSLHFSLLIFDVSGHDEKASQIRDNIVAHLPQITPPIDPALFSNSLNNFLLESTFLEDRFVSMLYGVIDLAKDSFTYANAGHNPPYLVRNEKLLSIKKNDLLLNISPYEYKNYNVNLSRGDSLVLYTDGLTEARKRTQNELFGTDRLEKAISDKKVGKLKAKKAVDVILNAVADEGFDIEDDITIQVYRHL